MNTVHSNSTTQIIQRSLEMVFNKVNFVTIVHELLKTHFSTGLYLLRVSNRNTSTSCEMCTKLTIKTPN